MENTGHKISYLNKEKFYRELNQELEALMTGIWFSDLSNFSALLYQHIPDINWVGFYLNHGGSLKLGPFQGLSACTEIAYSKGVCGFAFSKQETVKVDDVRNFQGHIACDSRSLSEVVIPLVIANQKWGVLDVDSPSLERFTTEDVLGLELLARTLTNHLSKASQSLPGL